MVQVFASGTLIRRTWTESVTHLRVWAVMMNSETVSMDITDFLASLVSAFLRLIVKQRAEQLSGKVSSPALPEARTAMLVFISAAPSLVKFGLCHEST